MKKINKRYGMPYMGSKTQILHKLDYIFQREFDKKYFIEPFCGGFSVSHYVLENYKFKVLANDLNEYVIDLYKEIFYNNSENIKKVWLDWIPREKFMDVRENPDQYPKWYVGYVSTIWSFGNNFEIGYLFGKEIENKKRILHQALVFGEYDESILWLKDIMPKLTEEYSKQKRLVFIGVYKKAIKQRAELQQLKQLERLQQLQQLKQLERLEQLERLQQLEQLERLQQLQQLEQLESMDWYEFIESIPKEILKYSFIYCDPPYENTAKYSKNSIDYNFFWDWFRNFPYPVYVSSYTAPEDIQPINYEQKASLLSAKGNNKMVQENIYFNGRGEQHATMYDLLFNPQPISQGK